MRETRTLTTKLRTAFAVARKEGWSVMLRRYWPSFKFKITRFYCLKESLPSGIPSSLTVLPEGYEFSVFSRDDVMSISRLSERDGYVDRQYVIDNFQRGDTCVGIKYKGEIAAFTWFSVDATRTQLYSCKLTANEAFLYDMYVLQSFRGKNLAPILRYKNYEALKTMGRDTFYSVTLISNAASLRFKWKLKARKVFFAWYISFFGIWRQCVVLRRYSGNGIQES